MNSIPFILALLLVALCETVYAISCSVTFYWDSGYNGGSFTLYDGNSRQDLTQYYNGNSNWNDRISSVKFNSGTDGRRCVVHACWNTYCSGQDYGGSLDYIDDQAYVGDFANDQFSSVAVFSFNPTTDSWAHLYKDCDYAGYQWFVTPGGIPNRADIFLTTLSKYHIGNDALSKVVVGPMAALNLFWDDNYHGGNYLIIGPSTVSCLTSNGWNDQTSSIRYYDLSSGGAFPQPVGSWVLQTSAGSNQALSWALTYGYSSTDTHSSSSTFSSELSTSVEAGIEFQGVGSLKTTVSAKISSSVSNSIENSISRSSSVTCTLTCAANSCPSGFTYLYTWHMSFQRPWDGFANTQLDSCNYVCRCTNSPPQCVLTNCLDSACNTCIQPQ